MKRTGIDHPKGRRLAIALNVPHYAEVGIRECIFHFAGRHAIQGNIGKWSDEEIAAAVGWPVESALDLVRALVETRVLESHPTHRLIVHDWHDHCDDSCRKTVANKGLDFVTRVPGYEEETHRFTYHSGTIPEEFRNLPPKPKPKPEPKPFHKSARSPADAEERSIDDRSDDFAAWYEVYPRKRKPRDAAKAYARAVKRIATERKIDHEAAVAWLLDVTRQFAASPAGQVSANGDFRPYPASWLNAGEYDTNPENWNQHHGARSPNRNRSFAGQEFVA